jgi:hypothetical protein
LAWLRPDHYDNGWIGRRQLNQHDGGMDLALGRSADAGEAFEHDAVTTGASTTVGAELCGRPVPTVISRG